jgi:hypothetical protein
MISVGSRQAEERRRKAEVVRLGQEIAALLNGSNLATQFDPETGESRKLRAYPGAKVHRALTRWLDTRTGRPSADYLGLRGVLRPLRDVHHQNLLAIRGELAVDPARGFFFRTTDDHSRLLMGFIQLGDQLRRLQRCRLNTCGRRFYAKRTDKRYCSPQHARDALRKTEEGRESRKVYMRDYRKKLKDHPKLQHRGENKSRRQS